MSRRTVGSRRSYAGSMHQRHGSKIRVTDDDLMNYVFRVALLSYQMQPKVEPQAQPETPREQRDYSSRLSGAITGSIVSIGDVFKDYRDGTKAVRFPKELLKVLEQKLQDIAMGKDPAYSDQLIRRTMAVFYGQVKEEHFRKQMKENRKIEEMILMFATNATNVLRKEPTLAGDGWKVELNSHIAQFIKLLRDCLQKLSHVSSELTARLDMYAAKLAPSTTSAPSYSDSGYDSSSTTRATRDRRATEILPRESGAAGSEDVSEEHQRGRPFPMRREDFDSEAAWQYWRTLETSHLSQLMVVMVQFNPELAKSTPPDALPSSQASGGRPGSIYSQYSSRDSSYQPQRHTSSASRISNRLSISGGFSPSDPEAAGLEVGDDDDDVPVGDNFTFIPPNPRKYYKRLLEYCIAADLEAMLSDTVGDDDEVSLGILSPPHIELINECALRWRIGQPYRAACFLDIVKSFYERNEVPFECIPEALQTLSKVMHEIELDKWPVQDHDYLCQIYGSLFNIFLSCLYHAMDNLPNLKPADVEPYLQILEIVRDSRLLERFDVDVTARMADVQEQIRSVSGRWYDEKKRELYAAPGVNKALPLLLLTDEMEKSAKLLDKRQLDIVALYVEIVVPLYLQDLDASSKRLFEDSRNGPTPDIPIQDIFSLYRRSKTVLGMYKAFCPEGDADFDLSGFFEPYVQQWLIDTDNKTKQWVQAAIAADKFQAEGTEGYSSSVIDLFDSLRSPVNFLTDLEWTDELKEAEFFTSLSKQGGRVLLSQRGRALHGRNVPSTSRLPPAAEVFRWLEKAKQLANSSEKKIEPFTFQPESCVKLNNVESARRSLDNMYAQIQADKKRRLWPIKSLQKNFKRAAVPIHRQDCMAEGLVPLDSSPSSRLDTFVTMEGEKHDPQFYFGRAFRSLKRAESDMVRVFVDKVNLPFVRQNVSRTVLKTLTRSGTLSIDYNKALGGVREFYRSALGTNNSEVQIPLPSSEKPRIRPEELTDVEIEAAITPVFDFFDANLPTLNTYLSDATKDTVMIKVWKEILNVIEGLLVPPLSEKTSDMKPLTDKEVDIVFKWLKFLRDYFYAGGEGPVPLESLQNQKYRDILSIRLYYDWHTDALMEECVRMMQQSLRASPSVKKRAKSVYSQRNLGTIKDRKREKQQEKEVSNGETILRILRMRPGTSDFIQQQLHTINSLQAEREAQAREAQQRKLQRPRHQQQQSVIPPVPSIPAIPPVPPVPPAK
ncbi:hypothetical protein BC629DRAFT_1622278 [Irpex lacteus]|nr:hypothetical protein BC629DRAFT_1622278 [Irpex lacteus]